MEDKISVYRLNRIRAYLLKRTSKKFVSLDDLAKGIGFYPEVLASDLVYFEPLILMDPSINIRSLLPAIEAYLAEEKEKKASLPHAKRQVAKKGEVASYKDYADFIYKRMAGPGGLLSASAYLDDHDLHILELLVKKEIKRRAKTQKSPAKAKRK